MTRTFRFRPIIPSIIALTLAFLPTIDSRGQATEPPVSVSSSIPLTEAMEKGWVKAFVSGSGIPGAQALKYRLSRTPFTPGDMPGLTLPTGTTLRSTNAAHQNMALARVRGYLFDGNSLNDEERMALHGQQSIEYLIEAYGTEYGKDLPGANTALEILNPNPRWACLFDAASAAGLGDRSKQAAVWLLGGRATPADVQSTFNLSNDDWNRINAAMNKCAPGSSAPAASPAASTPGMATIATSAPASASPSAPRPEASSGLMPAPPPPVSPRDVFDRLVDDPFGESPRKAAVEQLLAKWKALQAAGGSNGIAVQANTDFALSVPPLTRATIKSRLGRPDSETIHTVPGYRMTPTGQIASDDLSVNFLWYGQVGVGVIVAIPDDVAVAIGYRGRGVGR